MTDQLESKHKKLARQIRTILSKYIYGLFTEKTARLQIQKTSEAKQNHTKVHLQHAHKHKHKHTKTKN